MMPTSSPIEPAQAGFTLFELLVVLTIMGLVAALGAQRLGQTPGSLVRAQVAGQLRAAIADAVRASQVSGRPAVVDLKAGKLEQAAVRFRPSSSSDPVAPLTVYPDGSVVGGTLLLGARPLLAIDWLTGEVRDATR